MVKDGNPSSTNVSLLELTTSLNLKEVLFIAVNYLPSQKQSMYSSHRIIKLTLRHGHVLEYWPSFTIIKKSAHLINKLHVQTILVTKSSGMINSKYMTIDCFFYPYQAPKTILHCIELLALTKAKPHVTWWCHGQSETLDQDERMNANRPIYLGIDHDASLAAALSVRTPTSNHE